MRGLLRFLVVVILLVVTTLVHMFALDHNVPMAALGFVLLVVSMALDVVGMLKPEVRIRYLDEVNGRPF